MKATVLKILSSYVTMMVLLAIYAIAMAAATFIENAHGTPVALRLVYHSPLFFLLHLLLVLNFIVIAIKRNLFKSKRWGLLVIHFSFVIILIGALITHLTGQEGLFHLREGQISNQMVVQTADGAEFYTLPFHIELIRFTVTRYPGSTSPSAFESEVFVHIDGTTRHERIYMNNVLDVGRYRFFQVSFDEDENGTILSVNRDVAGRTVTYIGYLLLLIGSIFSLLGKRGRIRTLYRKLNYQKVAAVVVVGLLSFSGKTWASTETTTTEAMLEIVQTYVVPPAHAERFGALTTQSACGRMMPVNTFSSQILRKLYSSTRFGQLNPDQFLLSLFVMPEIWAHVPLINVSNAVADYFGLPRRRTPYVNLFCENDEYKLRARFLEALRTPPGERTRFDRALISLDERVHIFHQLSEFRLLYLFPKPDSPIQRWYAPGDDLSEFMGMDSMFVSTIFFWYLSEVQNALLTGDWRQADEILNKIAIYQTAQNNIPDLDFNRIALEVTFNNWEFFRRAQIGYLVLGALLLMLTFLTFFGVNPLRGWLIKGLGIGVIAVFLFHAVGIGMRWHIAGFAPFSNSFESMTTMAWLVVLTGLIFARRSPMMFSFATLFGGIILFVTSLNWMNPQITPLVPVLQSPWLMYHASTIIAAYGLFGIGFLLGIFNLLILRKEKLRGLLHELTAISEMMLIIGLILITIGSFIGGVWANESWGRYWGWDPKETWSLITIVIYAMVTHLHLVRKWYSVWLFNLCAVIAFASVLMTYFGVSLFLGGLHTYG